MAENYKLQLHTCRVCGEQNLNKVYTAKEMMYGMEDEFPYFVCESCGCMQIAEVPKNLGEYYGNHYYSMSERVNTEFDGEVTETEKILDVGCGTGAYLLHLAEQGYGNLYGCDPFIEQDIRYGDRVYIRKCEISDMEGKYDKIQFIDSFEHVTNPLETLYAVKRLLSEDGECRIELPIFPNAAWDVFGVNWYQLDAPRHIFLHSKESLRYLCEKAGLKIEKIEDNSNNSQFIKSYLYEQGISLREQLTRELGEFMTKEDWTYFTDCAAKVKQKGYGDHVYLIIKHA